MAPCKVSPAISTSMTKIVSSKTASRTVAAICAGLAVLLFLAPPPAGVPPEAMRGAALTLFTMGLFATGAMPEVVTSLLFFLLAMLFAVAPAGVVFSGFESSALWLVFGGLVVGVAVQRTALGAWLAQSILGVFGNRYPALVVAVAVVGVVLAIIMPATLGRVVMFIPIVAALADRLGFPVGSAGRNGLVLSAAFGTWMPSSAILPANLPNVVLAGVAETTHGIVFTYGHYGLVHGPVVGLLKAVAIVFCVLFFFPDASRTSPVTAAPVRLSPEAKRLGILLIATVVLWATDFLHGISPAWISLGAAVICLLPWVSFVPPQAFSEKVNFGLIVYIAAILGVGTVVVSSGFGAVLGRALLEVTPLSVGADFGNFFALVGLATLINVVVTAPGVAVILGPQAGDLSAATGFPLASVLLLQVVGYSTILLPYQAPPIIVALQIGGVEMRPAAKFTLALAAVTLAVLVPINYLWWQALGLLR